MPLRHFENLGKINHTGAWGKYYQEISSSLGGGAMFALVGNRGTGKTQLSCACIASLILEDMRKNKGIVRNLMYTKVGDLFREIKSTFNKNSDDTEDNVVEKYTNYALLVIDECHERAGSEFESRILTNILDHRYDEKKDTIMIANQTPEAFAAGMGDSVVRRVNETGKCITCDWETK